ncbi:MAG: hypothetical protein U0441_14550 [Polyangiaceae bacterium]
MKPRRRLEGSSLWGPSALLPGALALVVAGCGAPPPAAPAAPTATPKPPLQVVEADAPFIVDWDSPQMASLTAALQAPNGGGVVVSYQRNVMRLLPDCHLTGKYVPSAIGMYRGLLQVRRADSPARGAGTREDALQQTATSANVAQGAVLDYRFVIVGRHYLAGAKDQPTTRDLASRTAEGCRDATHYVRAGLTGAFERTGGLDPTAPQPLGAPLPKDGKASLRGGDFTACMMAGTAGTPACSAFVKIEIAAIAPAPAADAPPPGAATGAVAPLSTIPPMPTVAPLITIAKPGDPAPAKTAAPAVSSAPPAPTSAPQIAIPKPPASVEPAPSSAPSAAPAPADDKAPGNKAPGNKAPDDKAP